MGSSCRTGNRSPQVWKVIHQTPVFINRVFEDFPMLALVKEIGGSIYEKWDGSGYPFGRKGEEIPLSARITALANVYDTLRTERSYKKAYSHEKALTILREGDERINPRHFDPAILEIFLSRHEEIASSYADLSSD
ncbi:MAG: HD domain-containing phosphohydrolase [Spirochaetota bacterium]